MSDVNIRVSIISRGAQRSIRALERDTKGLEKSFKAVNVSIKNSVGALQVFAGNVAARAFTSLTTSLVSAANGFVTAGIEVEKLGTQLEVLTGSTGAANKLLGELKEFSAGTPFQLQDLTAAANQLLAFGFAADDVTNKLQKIGDVAAASNTPVKELTLIYGQVAAAGKLTGERLLQLQERAIPIGPALAETLGVAESAVRDLVSEGAVDLATFEKAFSSLSEEGGAAFGGIAKQSRTLSGRISTLKDNFFLLQESIGSTLGPALKAGASALTDFLGRLRVDARFQQFLEAIGNGIPKAIQFAGSAINAVNIVFNKFRQALEVISIASSIFFAGISQAILNILTPLTLLNTAFEKLFGISSTGLTQAVERLKAFRDAAVEGAGESVQAIKDIQVQQEATSQFIVQSTGQIVKSYQEEKAAAEAKSDAVVEGNKKEMAAQQEKFEFSKELDSAIKEQAELTRIEEADIKALKASEDLRLLEETLGTETALKTAARQRELKAQGQFATAAIELENQLAKAKNKAAVKQAQAKEGFTKKEIDATKSALSTISTLTANSNKTLFRIGKAAAIGKATIDGIAAVQSAFKDVPYPFNFAAAALVGVATAANVAKISSQQPPSFQSGGIVAGNSLTGDRVNANLNSGELVLNRNQQTELLGIANGSRGAGASGGQEIVVNTVVELDGEAVARAVSRQVADGFELGEVV